MTPRQTRDQHMCPPSAMQPTPIAERGHHRRSQGCGRVALLRNRATPDRGAFARLFCKARNCHDCGPRRAARYHREHLELLTAWWNAQTTPVLWAFEVAPEAWSSLARKLRRHLAAYDRIPIAAGADLVITTATTGHEVRKITTLTELQSTLEAAFTWHPGYAGDRRRPSHRGFDGEPVSSGTAAASSGASDQGKPKADVSSGTATGWELLAFAGGGITLADAMRTTDALELEPEPMPERELPADWAEAFTFHLPPDDSPTYWLLIDRLQLRAPGADRYRHGPRGGQLELGGVAA